ncbi:MAG: 3-oxoacyl-ACP reductase FabG [Lachnospiraceae bacterium]|nr:3-oxoacyl-ACP reductase FabG [Lachnospiraceae bacterium]
MKKVALVTGASRGIGRAVALRLAREGYGLGISFLERQDKAEEVAEQIRKEGGEALCCQADVAEEEAVRRMTEEIRRKLGPVTLLVSNAGIAGQRMIQDITAAEWQRYFDVNLGGFKNCVQAVLPDMLRAKSGSIVSISSIWGLRGASCESLYSATKHAVIGLTKSLAMELAPSGIRVNCVAPGVIDTDMVQVLGQDTLKELAAMTPLGRLGRPEEIAEAAAFLGGEKASFITGQVLTVDGGFSG